MSGRTMMQAQRRAEGHRRSPKDTNRNAATKLACEARTLTDLTPNKNELTGYPPPPPRTEA
jgi:hypothetical protein